MKPRNYTKYQLALEQDMQQWISDHCEEDEFDMYSMPTLAKRMAQAALVVIIAVAELQEYGKGEGGFYAGDN